MSTSGSPRLGDAVGVGPRTAPSRLVFGPHETNLADGRALSARHVAYYARRAAGGAGIVVTETASVTEDDWPYERAPLAAACRRGWEAVARACEAHDTLVLAGLGHAGSQGSSAYSQRVMWAPSPVADVVTREPPAALEEEQITALVSDFAGAARAALEAGLAGVEVDAGAWSLLRQFHSGLTNLRDDRFGADRLLFTRLVLEGVRQAVGPDGVVALRLSCDELAPWAGVTPEQAAAMVAEVAGLVDLLTVVRGGPYSTGAYRPDSHVEAGFNRDLCRQMRHAAAGQVPVVLQGSVTDPAMAAEALAGGVCDLVEMTRALIADPGLLRAAQAGLAPRPCIRCNQACRVRDPRNPIVSCVMDPSAGHETEEVFEAAATAGGPDVLVVGGGPSGMECARVLALAGRRVHLAERSAALGGVLARAAVGPGRTTLGDAAAWLASELGRLGVDVSLGTDVGAADVVTAQREGRQVVLATGSRALSDRWSTSGLPVVDALSALEGPSALPDGPVVVVDTVGDAVGVNLAQWLAETHGRPVTLVCPDPVAGTQLARTGDLADANGRLQRAGVRRQLRSLVRGLRPDGVDVEDCWTGRPEHLPAAVLVDCGHRLPDDTLYQQIGDVTLPRAGDCVAPRTLLEAMLEGRRIALGLLAAVGTPA